MPDPEWVYFDFTSVAYRRDDPFGELLALFSLAPVFAMVAYATAIAARRDLQTLILLVGQLANLALNLVLKKAIDQARPAAHADSGVGGAFRTAGSSSGMPSNHAQFCTFLATCAALFIARRTRRPAMMKAFWVAGLWAVAVACCVSRWALEYHTANQVVVGAGVGSAFGLLYYALYAVLLAPRCPGIARSRLCAWFYIKDLSLIPNALEFEHGHAARAYQEKHD